MGDGLGVRGMGGLKGWGGYKWRGYSHGEEEEEKGEKKTKARNPRQSPT